jgi:Flp pilus assembly pilin Flp
LIALAATAGMGTLAGNINTAFTNMGTKLTSYTS